MVPHQISKRRQALKHRSSSAILSRSVDPDHLALPPEKIRALVVRSVTRFSIEPFVKQMVRVMDHLKAGRTAKVARLHVSPRDRARAVLVSAIADAARKGRTMAAHETAFLAALYAYENSVHHLTSFLDYLDRLRRPNSLARRESPKLR